MLMKMKVFNQLKGLLTLSVFLLYAVIKKCFRLLSE